MQQQTESKQEEQLNGQSSTEENSKDTYLNLEIEGAKPLRLVGSDEMGYCIVFGKYRITEIKPTPNEALEQPRTNLWEMIINLIGAITGQTQELKDRMK